MSEIRKWLEAIGLGQYGDAFEANKIDMDLLRQVDDLMSISLTSKALPYWLRPIDSSHLRISLVA